MSAKQTVEMWLIEECGVPPRHVADDAGLVDLGVDSLDLLAFGMYVEDTLRFRPDEKSVLAARTVGDLLRVASRNGGDHLPRTGGTDHA